MSRVCVTVGCPSVCLSHLLVTVALCSGLLLVTRWAWDWSVAGASAQQQMRTVTFLACVEGWRLTCLLCFDLICYWYLTKDCNKRFFSHNSTEKKKGCLRWLYMAYISLSYLMQQFFSWVAFALIRSGIRIFLYIVVSQTVQARVIYRAFSLVKTSSHT